MNRFPRLVRLILLGLALIVSPIFALALSTSLPTPAMLALTFAAMAVTFGYLAGKLQQWW